MRDRCPIEQWAARSVAGRRRFLNGDRYGLNADLGVVLLADAVSSGSSGDRASDLALSSSFAYLVRMLGAREVRTREAGEILREAFQFANGVVFRAAHSHEQSDMAASMVGAIFTGTDIVVGSVGDLRAYGLRGHSVRLLTAFGCPAEERRFLGVGPNDVPDVGTYPVAPGDLFAFCSTELADAVPPFRMSEEIGASDDLETACDRLISVAIDAGVEGHMTVVLVRPHRPIVEKYARHGEQAAESPDLMHPGLVRRYDAQGEGPWKRI